MTAELVGLQADVDSLTGELLDRYEEITLLYDLARAQYAESASELVTGVLAGLASFTDSETQRDDITPVALHVTDSSEEAVHDDSS